MGCNEYKYFYILKRSLPFVIYHSSYLIPLSSLISLPHLPDPTPSTLLSSLSLLLSKMKRTAGN